MPVNQRQQTVQSTSSTAAQSTAKYTNKDGSRFITVPKVFSSGLSETSPAMAQITTKANGQAPQHPQGTNGNVVGVNRKKQKRRQKQAERLAAEQASKAQNTSGAQGSGQHNRQPQVNSDYQRGNGEYDPADSTRANYSDDEGDEYSGSYEHSNSPANGYAMSLVNTKLKKKRKGKGAQPEQSNQPNQPASSRNNISNPPLAPPPLQMGMSKEKIWNTSSQEERERIKMFWLSLGEEERRSLVKVEKDAVLKKMKEQQKHSCSCTVCGRKRIAIEEELEVLYDAYYEELEQYANHQQGEGPPPMMAASRRFGPMSGLQPPNRLPPDFSGRQPSRGKIFEHFDNDEDEEADEEGDEYSAEEDDYLSDEEPVEEAPRSHATDFFNFGQSLTVQGGILTVADDLLKNDGKKFIEMMEQLAERRMAREEDAKEQFNTNGYVHPPNGNIQPHHHAHNHAPPPEEEDYDEEEEEEDEYDSQDDDYEEEEMETMTEEQRMEEGRRMFQIFAARMFEQRVLTAYKEKVAAERQEKLLQELEDENLSLVQKKAKKAKDAQRKKEKAHQKKLALAEEKAKREAEKAAEEAALHAAEEKKAEEARLKAEEKRRKRDLQRKVEEEERLRKDTEKQRRLQEQRERQAELERKQREAKERERKEKEELRQKEREAKEAKEREARERKEKLEKGRRDLEAKTKAEREAKEQQRREEQVVQQAAHSSTQLLKRPHQHITIPLPSGLQPSHSFIAPHVPVATPVIPKAPTPNRPSTTSQKDPNSVPQTPQVGKSQSTSPNLSSTQQSSPSSFSHPAKAQGQQPFLHHPQATSPIHSTLKGPVSTFPPSPFTGVQPIGMNGFQPGMPMMTPGFVGRMPLDPVFAHQPMGSQFRPLSGPNGMHMPPGMNGIPMQQGRGFQPQHPPPGFPQQLPNGALGGMGQPFGHKDSAPTQTHSRQQSASFEKPTFEGATSTQPIARPAPIGRPSSIVQGQQPHENDIDGLSNHLGSSALLDDSDEPLNSGAARRSSIAPGLGIGRQGFMQNVPYGMDHSTFTGHIPSYNTWGGPPNPFGTAPLPGANYMGGWGAPPSNGFGAVGGAPNRPSQPRSVAVRLMLCRACKTLEGTSQDGFHSINAIREQVERLGSPRDERITDKELLDLCETEGNINNGGGSFEVREEDDGRIFIRHDLGIASVARPVGAPGEIGSPVVGGIQPMSRFPGPPGIPAPSGF